MEKLKQERLFNSLKEFIELSLFKQLLTEESNIPNIIERIKHIDETTIIYLMQLTNDYIRATLTKNSISRDIDITLFAKLGFDITLLDSLINKLPKTYYNYNIAMTPDKLQEEILQIVFNYFGCPGRLPTIDDILDINGYLAIDIQNNLPLEYFIQIKLQLEQIMLLYKAPKNTAAIFNDPTKITSIIPETNSEIIQNSTKQALDLYRLSKRTRKTYQVQ